MILIKDKYKIALLSGIIVGAIDSGEVVLFRSLKVLRIKPKSYPIPAAPINTKSKR